MTNTRLSPDQVRATTITTLDESVDTLNLAASKIFLSEAIALSGTSDGDYFKVPEAGGDRLFYNNAGVAEDQNILHPSDLLIDQEVTNATTEGSLASAARTAAESARDDAIADANAAGAVKTYNTYALADADKGNRPLNSLVQVRVDENKNAGKTIYKVETGPILTFQHHIGGSGWESIDHLTASLEKKNKKIAIDLGLIPRAQPSLDFRFGDDSPRHTVGGRSVDLSDMLTYTGVPNRTHFNAQGKLVGVDFTTGSFVNNTSAGRNVFNTVLADDLLQITLDSDADNHRDWVVSKKVRLSQESNGANYVDGTVESYSASTQVLILRVTATGVGAVNPALLKLSNLEIRDATYDPGTGEKLGLLIEPAATNLLFSSNDVTTGNWTLGTGGTATAPVVSTSTERGIDGNFAQRIVCDRGAGNTTNDRSTFGLTTSITLSAGSPKIRYLWLKSATGENQQVMFYDTTQGGEAGTFGDITVTPEWQRFEISGGSSANAHFALGTRGGNDWYTGGQQVVDVLFSHAQIEASNTASTPIPTRTVAVTRPRDSGALYTIPSSLGDTLTILIDFTPDAVMPGSSQHVFDLSDASGLVSMRGFYFSGFLRLYSRSGGGFLSIGEVLIGSGRTRVALRVGESESRAVIYLSGERFITTSNFTGIGSLLGGHRSVLSLYRPWNPAQTSNLGFGKMKQISIISGPVTDAEMDAWVSEF